MAKYVCLGVLVFSIGYFLFNTTSTSYSPGRKQRLLAGLMVVIQISLWFYYVKLSRLPHIKDHVRLAPLMMLIQLFLWIGYWKVSRWYQSQVSSGSENAWINWFWILYQISTWVWYWMLARLFRQYELGRIFAAETIHSIKILGCWCVIGWLLSSATLIYAPFSGAHPLTAWPMGLHQTNTTGQATNDEVVVIHRPPVSVRHFTVTHYNGFFAFDFGTGINFGQLFIGLIIVLIAWIMDEGRKIQEEQALTV
jgi:hypothetical protein